MLEEAGEQLGRVIERKESEKALKESEERFNLVVAGTNDGIWDWVNIKSDSEYWSPQFFNLLGYKNNEIKCGKQ